MSITLTLPYPPTANNLFLNARKGRVKAPAYRVWQSQALAAVLEQEPRLRALALDGQLIQGPYRLRIEADRPDRRRRDLANLEKPISDLLTLARVIRDDSDAKSIHLAWTDKDPAPGATVSVTVWRVLNLPVGSVACGENARSIAAAVASAHGVTLAELRGPLQARAVAWARQAAMYELHATGLYSLAEIGRFFARDHTTVRHGVGRHAARLEAAE